MEYVCHYGICSVITFNDGIQSNTIYILIGDHNHHHHQEPYILFEDNYMCQICFLSWPSLCMMCQRLLGLYNTDINQETITNSTKLIKTCDNILTPSSSYTA